MQTLVSVSAPCGVCGPAIRPKIAPATECDTRYQFAESSVGVSNQGLARHAHDCEESGSAKGAGLCSRSHPCPLVFHAQAKKQATGLLVRSEVLQQQLAARDASLAQAAQQLQAAKAEADAAAVRHESKARSNPAIKIAQPGLLLPLMASQQ